MMSAGASSDAEAAERRVERRFVDSGFFSSCFSAGFSVLAAGSDASDASGASVDSDATGSALVTLRRFPPRAPPDSRGSGTFSTISLRKSKVSLVSVARFLS